MLTYEYFGNPLTQQKLVPGNTSTGLSASCYEYLEFTLLVNGVDSGSTEPTAGGWVVGVAGGRGVIISATLTAGAYEADSARVTLRLKSVSGTFASTENVAYVANANHFTVRTGETQRPCSDLYEYSGLTAKCALVCVYDKTALVNLTGATPDQTSLIGMSIVANASYILRDINEIKNFKCLAYTNNEATILQVFYYF